MGFSSFIPNPPFSFYFITFFLSIKSGMGAVIETAKRNELNVFGYLSYLMLVLPSWGKTPSDEQLDSIMPWSATLPETCHRTYHQIVENEAVVE